MPPKIKHFWWQVLHNALSVADNISRRHIKISTECPFCGEATETTLHLLFHCRLAREIWELSPLSIPLGQYAANNNISDIVTDLLTSKNEDSSKELLFPYIGWRIWKARNALLFNNKRWAIPDIIHQALLDWRLWTEAQHTSHTHISQGIAEHACDVSSHQEYLHPDNEFYCCIDGSWANSDSRAGIGWALYDAQNRCIFKGSSSIDHAGSVIETEAIALREALLQLRRLSYRNVTLSGDSSTLYRYLEQAEMQCKPILGPVEIQTYLEDILALAKGSFHFKFIRREANVLADMLSKTARHTCSLYIISWIC